jgi:hypothetical protein
MRDFQIWQQAIETITPQGRPRFRLGRMIDSGHILWEWRSDRENLYHLQVDFMDIYTPIVATGNNQDHNRWMRSLVQQPQTNTGHICLVRIDPNREVVIQLQAEEA